MFGENLAIAFRALWANKMRSLLTTLGVVIGVAAVIAVVSIVQGFFFAVNNLFKDLGSGWVRVMAERPERPGWEGKLIPPLRRADADYLLEHASLVQDVAPAMFGGLQIKNGERISHTTILGTVPGYMDVVNFYVDRGRFFTWIDDKAHRKVCVIGAKVIEKLEIEEPIVGREIQLGPDSFTIVGVMEARGQLIGLSLDDYIFLPYETARNIFGEEQTNNTIWEVAVSDPDKMELAKTQIIDAMRRRRRLKADDPDDFILLSQEQITSVLGSISGYATGVAAGIAGVALFVGGIGIMNIMLVSVAERTREIGIRMAVGARSKHVRLQFLAEALVLSTSGGLIGIGVGILVSWLMAGGLGWPVLISSPSILVSVLFSAAVGVFFGYYPASKAAALDPIEALRYE
ncbi:MAG TPA: ABC transporter permease [Candidatus Polarisedimenticolia bacterium]